MDNGYLHGGHRQEVRDRSSPLGRHFSECGYKNFSLQIIDCVKEGEEEGTLQMPSPNPIPNRNPRFLIAAWLLSFRLTFIMMDDA